MSNQLVTECPDCKSRFRVSEGQLKMAEGQVRCGACLAVFDARRHQLNLPSENGTPPSEPVQQEQIQPQPKTLEGESEAKASPPPSTEPASMPVETQPQTEYRETAPIQPKPAKPAQPKQVKVSGNTPAQMADTVSQSTAEQLINPDILAGVKAPTEPAPSAKDPLSQLGTADPDQDHLGYHAEPVILTATRSQKRNQATWELASLIAAILLLAQYMWFERSQLVNQPLWQPIYTQVCELVPCELPMQQDVSQIYTSQLVIRPHSGFQEAMSVHMRLENRAHYAQPYPYVDLEFNDLKGRAVASRRFAPADYLDIDRIDPDKMPVNQPVEIEFALLNPGRRGVNYNVSLAPVPR